MGILKAIAGCAGAFAAGVVQGMNGTCPKCGRTADGKSLFCPSCGTKLPNHYICETCGTFFKNGNFCPQCGKAAPKGETAKEHSSTELLKKAENLYMQGECAEAVRLLEEANYNDDLLFVLKLIVAGDYKTAVDTFKLSEIIIPNGVRAINKNAFKDCISLVNVYLSDSVKSIGDSAFVGCSNLKSIRIPNGIETIDSSDLFKCNNLVYNDFDNANYLGNEHNPYLFLVNAKSKDIDSCAIHNDTKIIGKYSFQDCFSISKITLPHNVTSIEKGAFENCICLLNITINNHLKYIGDYAFWGCDNLEDVYYTGTNLDWQNIIISSEGNYIFDNIAITHNYSIPQYNVFANSANEVTSSQAAPKSDTQTSATGKINVEELKQLKELLDMGIITQEEFNAKKQQLLGL